MLHSATVNPAPLPLPMVVPYARTPTGQGVDCLILGVFSALPKKGTVSAKADTPLFRLPIIPPKTAPLTYWQVLGSCGGSAPTPPTSPRNCIGYIG